MLYKGEKVKIFFTSWVATRFNNQKQKHQEAVLEELMLANQLDQMELVEVADMGHLEE